MTSTTTTRKASTTTTRKASTTRSRKATQAASLADIPAAIKASARRPKATTQPPAPEPTEATEGRACACGTCSLTVRGKKARYAPGHDARHAGIVGRSLVGMDPKQAEAALSVLATEALQRKARQIGDAHAAKMARRQADTTAEAGA